MKLKFDTILGLFFFSLFLAGTLLVSGCNTIKYQRTTYHNSDELQQITDAKGNQSAVPQEEVEALSKGVFAKKEVRNFRFETTNSWDGTTYSQSKSVSTESASSDVSEQTTKIVESAVEGAVRAATGKPGT